MDKLIKFDAKNATPAAPASIFSEKDGTALAWAKQYGFESDTECGIALATVKVIYRELKGTTAWSMFGKGVSKDFCKKMAPPSGNDKNGTKDQEIDDWSEAHTANSFVWLKNILVRAKKNKLERENVAGYFASISSGHVKGGALARFYNEICKFFPDLISDSDYRATLSGSKWVKYGVSRVSTLDILRRCEKALRGLGIANAEEMKIISEAEEKSWDVKCADKISDETKAFAYQFLVAAGMEIEKWYQGKKALNSISSARAKLFLSASKRYLEIVNNAEGIEEATKVSALKGIINRGREQSESNLPAQ